MEDDFKFYKVQGTNLKLQEDYEWKAKGAGWVV